MKLSVLANLYGAKSLDETLKILTDLGVHTAEIGAGGYPGKAHCDPAELLADSKKLDEFIATFKKYDVEICALAAHGIPILRMPLCWLKSWVLIRLSHSQDVPVTMMAQSSPTG